MLLQELFEKSGEREELQYKIRLLKSELSNLSPVDQRRYSLESNLKRCVAKLHVLNTQITSDTSQRLKQDNKEQLKQALNTPKKQTISDIHTKAARDWFRRKENVGDWENISMEVLKLAQTIDPLVLNKQELAHQIGVDIRTINSWLQKRPEFIKVKRAYGL